MTKTRNDNNVIDRIDATTQKLELNSHDRSNKIRSIMKSRQDNDLTNRISVISKKCNTELSRSIG